MSGLLVLYDGVCGLCDRTVQVLLKADKRGILKFAPLQGSTATSVFSRHRLLPETESFRSIIFVQDYSGLGEKLFFRSEGVLRILAELGGVWRVVSWLRIVPLLIRDAVYNWVARNRYRWFGRFDECKLPPPDWQSRFLP